MTHLIDYTLVNDRRAVVPLLGFPGVYLNDTTIAQNVKDQAVHQSTLEAIARRFDMDGLFCLMDLSLEAGALGLEVRFPDYESPSVVEHPVKALVDLDPLAEIDILADARLQGFVSVVREMRARFDGLIGAYAIGPFSLAGILMGATEAAIATIMEPELLHAAIRFSTDLIKGYIATLEDAGADTVAILEPTASLLAPRQFAEFAGDYCAEIIADMSSMSILHICGQTTKLIDGMVATGAQGLSLDSAVDFGQTITRVPDDVVLIGNLDTVAVMNQMTPEQVHETASALLTEMAPYPNFILSSACDLPLATPHANIDAMIAAARD